MCPQTPESVGNNETVSNKSEINSEQEKAILEMGKELEQIPPINDNNPEKKSETLSGSEELAKELLKDPQFANLSEGEKAKIKQKALEMLEEYEMVGIPVSLEELKVQFETSKEENEAKSVQDEFNERNKELIQEGKTQKERLIILINEFQEKESELSVGHLESARKALDVLNYTEKDKSISTEEKTVIQSKLENTDLFSPGGFESAMQAVYQDENISEKTKEKLIQVSGVLDVPKIDIKTPSDLSEDLQNRNEARKEQYSKLKSAEKELVNKKKELEKIPESERTEEQIAELEGLKEQLQTVKKQKEYFDESNRSVVTRRPLSIGGTAELSQKNWLKPARTVLELNGIRLPLDASSSEKQNLGITCLHSYDRMENGSGKQSPMHLGRFVFNEIENNKPLKESQYGKTEVISHAMGFENGAIITNEQLRQEEMVLHAFRNPNSPKTPEGAKQDLRGLGLLKEGENKMSYEGVQKMADMIHFIRNTTSLPAGYKSKYDYLKDKYKKKDDEK